MSKELETVEAARTSPAVHVTSFFGGTARGRCVQLTQNLRTDGGFTTQGLPPQCLSLTEGQAADLVDVLQAWLGRNEAAPLTEDRVREIVEDVLEEKANEWSATTL